MYLYSHHLEIVCELQCWLACTGYITTSSNEMMSFHSTQIVFLLDLWMFGGVVLIYFSGSWHSVISTRIFCSSVGCTPRYSSQMQTRNSGCAWYVQDLQIPFTVIYCWKGMDFSYIIVSFVSLFLDNAQRPTLQCCMVVGNTSRSKCLRFQKITQWTKTTCYT